METWQQDSKHPSPQPSRRHCWAEQGGDDTAAPAWLGGEHHRMQLNHPKCQNTARNPYAECCRSSASGTIWRVIYWARAIAPHDPSKRKEKTKKGSVLWSQTDFSETHSLRFCILYMQPWMTVKWEPQITSGKLGNSGDQNNDICFQCLVVRVDHFPLAGAPGSRGILQALQRENVFKLWVLGRVLTLLKTEATQLSNFYTSKSRDPSKRKRSLLKMLEDSSQE